MVKIHHIQRYTAYITRLQGVFSKPRALIIAKGITTSSHYKMTSNSHFAGAKNHRIMTGKIHVIITSYTISPPWHEIQYNKKFQHDYC